MGGVTCCMKNNIFYPLFLVSSHVLLREASARLDCCVALSVTLIIPNLGALPIIASFSLMHIPALLACFESVSCVYTFFSTCMSICVARAACTPFCFRSSFSTNSMDTHVTVPFDVHITMSVCLSSSSVCISICLIAYVYVNLYTHFPPVLHLCTTIAVSIFIYVTITVKLARKMAKIYFCYG